MQTKREDHEPPLATSEWGWKYHHIGIPTSDKSNCRTYMEKFKLSFGGFDSSPYGIEWMHYEEGSPVDELIKKVPHIAFEVDDLDYELKVHDFNIITPPNAPGEGVRVAMIEHNGAPIELIEFDKSKF